MKLKEVFDNLNSFIDKSLSEDNNKIIRWNPKVARQSLEVMGFKKWDLSFDDEKNDTFPSFWIHESGLYVLLDKSKINMVVLSYNVDVDWKKEFKEYKFNDFVTPYGYSILEHSFSINSFEGLHNFSNSIPSIKHVFAPKHWSPVIFNSMAEKLTEIKNFGFAYFKDALSIYVNESKDDEIKIKKQAQIYLNALKINGKFEILNNTSSFLDYKIIKLIKKKMPTWYKFNSDTPVISSKEKEILLISDFLHGKSNVSWENVKEKSQTTHPLFWVLEFIVESNFDRLNEFITTTSYPIIDDIVKKLTPLEIKQIWEHENQGQFLFFNCLLKNQDNLCVLQHFFDVLRKHSKLDFLDDSIFNFKKMFKKDNSYQLSILGRDASDDKVRLIQNNLPEFLQRTPELFKKSSNNEQYLSLFLKDISKESSSDSFIVGSLIAKVVEEKELFKKLTPLSSNFIKGPRF